MAPTNCEDCPYENTEYFCIHEALAVKMSVEKFSIVQSSPGWCPLKTMTPFPIGTLASISRAREITIFNNEGKIVGVIDFSGDKLTFVGGVDEAADSLFSFLKFIIDPYFEPKKRFGEDDERRNIK